MKKELKKVLAEYEQYGLYQYWPVPAGYGASSLDCLVCYFGFFIAIETKAPGEVPTPRQHLCIDQINTAKGATFVVTGNKDGSEPLGLERLREHLEWITSAYQRKA